MKMYRKFSRGIVLATAVGIMSACAVAREQSTAGQYIDDSVVTTQVKAKFAESKAVNATSINVETLKGTVQLSGFAKSETEKEQAEKIAKAVSGVKEVENDIVVKP